MNLLTRRGCARFLALAIAVALAAGAHPAAADTVRNLVYRVTHSTFGDIGTYSNLIDVANGVMTVKTTAHLVIKMVGVVVHREEAQRVEQWQGNRLVSFHGVTVTDGEPYEVKGKAQGNKFVITTPKGTVTAPATVHPSNPLSPVSLQTSEMMRVENGKVEPVQISGGGETTVNVGGVAIPAREFKIGGSVEYRVWFDRHDVPVKFIVYDSSGEVEFSLQR